MQPAANNRKSFISKMLDTDPTDYLLPIGLSILIFTTLDNIADKNKKINQFAQACRQNIEVLQAQTAWGSNGLVLLDENGEPFICQLAGDESGELNVLVSRPKAMHRAPLVAPEETSVLDGIKNWLFGWMDKAHLPGPINPHQPAAPERRP